MLCGLMMGAVWLLAPYAGEEEAAQRFVEALRSRRLDGILESYVREESTHAGVSPSGLTPAIAPALAVELARSLAQRAAESKDLQQRQSLWQNADTVLDAATQQATEPILRARLWLERVELGWAESHWLADWDELRGQTDGHPSAVGRLRQTLERANQLVTWMGDRLAELSRQAPASMQKETIAQLKSIAESVTLARGNVALALSKALPKSDQAEQKQLLEKAVADFRAVTSEEPTAHLLAIRGSAEALRELGQPDQAILLLDSIPISSLAEPERSKILCEKVEVLLADHQTLEALKIVHAERSARASAVEKGSVDPRWEYLYLKVVLQQASEMPSDPKSASKLQASALRQLRLLDGTADRIWVRRAESLLSKHAGQLMLPEATEYRQAAEILTRSGDHRQAAEVFKQAADKAGAKGEIDNVVSLLDESARAWEKAGDFVRARDSFEALVAASPDSPLAPEAKLRSAINARRAYLENRDPSLYATLWKIAEEHLSRYGEDDSAGDVHYLMGTLRKAERQYEQAVAQFLAVPRDHRLYIPSRVAASRTYELWKTPLDPESPADGSLGQVIAFHEGLVSPLSPDMTRLDAESRAELIVRLSLFLLDRRVDQPAAAQKQLEALLADPQTPHEWIQQARRYLILALVRQRQFADAERWADLHARSNLQEIRLTLERLHEEAEAISELERKFVGRVQAHLVSFARRDKDSLTSKETVDWTLALARVELHLGNDTQLAEAIHELEELRKTHPQDARISELVGLCYLRSQRYDSATNIFRQLAQGLPEGTVGWYRAKLYLIISLRRAGQIEQARRLLETLEILHPELGGEHLREGFRQEHDALFQQPGPRLPGK
ncbi:hypothetical protein K2X85_20150 [bacterium]|nr:hypothetical protein [bacterium]